MIHQFKRVCFIFVLLLTFSAAQILRADEQEGIKPQKVSKESTANGKNIPKTGQKSDLSMKTSSKTSSSTTVVSGEQMQKTEHPERITTAKKLSLKEIEILKKWILEDIIAEVPDLECQKKVMKHVRKDLLEIDTQLTINGAVKDRVRDINRLYIGKVVAKKNGFCHKNKKRMNKKQMVLRFVVLEILSEPVGANAELNGSFIGQTPCYAVVIANKRVIIRASLPGYTSNSVEYTVRPKPRLQVVRVLLRKIMINFNDVHDNSRHIQHGDTR